MTLNEFMRANKMTFADVEAELNRFKTAEEEKRKSEKKDQLTKDMIKIVVEYATLFSVEVPEEEKEMIIELLCPILGPTLEKAAKETANNIKIARTSADAVRTPTQRTKTTVTEKDLEDILNILSL